MTFEGAFDFQIKLVGRNEIGFKDLDKTMKKDFTNNKSKEGKDQALEYVVERYKYTKWRHESFEKFNFSISGIALEVKIPRRWIGITMDD